MSDRQRSALYDSLERLLASGLPFETLFETLRRAHRNAAVQDVITRMEQAVRAGEPLSVAMQAASESAFPSHHALLVRAAELSGNLPARFRALAIDQRGRIAAKREILRRSAYPLLLFHVAVLGPGIGLFMRDPWSYLLVVLAILVPVDLLLWQAFRVLDRPDGSRLQDLLLRIPGLGRLLRLGSYRDWFGAVHQLYEAGVPLAEAARDASTALRQGPVRDEVERALAPLERREPFAAALDGLSGLDEDCLGMLVSAEPAGELGRALGDCAERYTELETAARARFVKVVCTLLFLSAAGYVAFRVFSFYDDYFDQLSKI